MKSERGGVERVEEREGGRERVKIWIGSRVGKLNVSILTVYGK